MGAYSPVPALASEVATEILDTVIAPVVDELRPYRGVLFAGMMLTDDGPKVLEFNCRFGDPETQVLLPRMPFRVGTLLHACATGRLAYEAGHANVDDGAAVTVVLTSDGYPGRFQTGLPITGVERAQELEGVIVFQAGTARDGDGRLVTAGGRVLAVTGTGATIAEARVRAYAGVDRIHFDGMGYRTDIAAVAAEEAA
jgi:phosphoribosylamine--glycine ligase